MKNSGSEIARQRDHVDDLVRQAASEMHGQHAEPDGERHRDYRGEGRKEKRIAETRADLFADGILAGPGCAEIPLDRIPEPFDVAGGYRPIEAELAGADIGDGLRRRRLAQIGRREIAPARL